MENQEVQREGTLEDTVWLLDPATPEDDTTVFIFLIVLGSVHESPAQRQDFW